MPRAGVCLPRDAEHAYKVRAGARIRVQAHAPDRWGTTDSLLHGLNNDALMRRVLTCRPEIIMHILRYPEEPCMQLRHTVCRAENDCFQY